MPIVAHPFPSLLRLLTITFPAMAVRAQVDWERQIVLPPLSGHAMASDTLRNRVVLFGGSNSGGRVDETWEWDGSTWAYLGVAIRPSSRASHAMAFDVLRGRTVLFGGSSTTGSLSDTWEWDGVSWTQRMSPVSPPPRFGHGMTFDSVRNRVVMFGGFNTTANAYLADLWEWDGATWTQANPALGPSPRQTQLAFDSVRNRTVLFGGCGPNNTLGDTWEWDGTNWLQRNPAQNPTPRMADAFAFDAGRGRTVLLSASIGGNVPPADTWEWDGTNWTPRGTTTAMRRRFQQMAYDPVHQRVMVFGGRFWDGGPRVPYAVSDCSDTHEWDGTSWVQVDGHTSPPRSTGKMAWDPVGLRVLQVTAQGSYATTMLSWHWRGDRWVQLQPAISPSERWNFTLATDPARRRVVMFGGVLPYSSTALSQTWEWDSLTWSPQNPPQRPSSRFSAALAYCSANNKVVLFGGYEALSSTYFGDTWEWDGNNWLQRTPGVTPPARSDHVMHGDDSRAVVVLFGGYTGSNTLGDTWEWDGNNWLQRAPAQSPPARIATAMTFDTARRRIVLDGGNPNSSGTLADTWEWDGANWTQRTPTAVPPGRYDHQIAFDQGAGRVVLYGGGDAVTWDYGPIQPASFNTMGAGCPGSFGVPTLAPSSFRLPWLGDTFTDTVSPVPPGSFSVATMGFTLSLPRFTLPLPLDPFGLPGCVLHIAPEASLLLGSVNGVTTWSLPVPNQLSLLGQIFYQQVAVLDPGANAAGMVMSNACTGVIGGR